MIYLGIINNVTVSSLLMKEFIVDKLADLLSFKGLVERSPGIKSIIDDYNKKSLVLQNIKILDTIQKLFDQIQAIKEDHLQRNNINESC